MLVKLCPKCLQPKPVAQFGRKRPQLWCNACRNSYKTDKIPDNDGLVAWGVKYDHYLGLMAIRRLWRDKRLRAICIAKHLGQVDPAFRVEIPPRREL